MPSDPRVVRALAAMKQPIAEFRGMARNALLQAEAFRAAQTASSAQRLEQAAGELGVFGAAHLSVGRFAALFPTAPLVSGEALLALEEAITVLRTFVDVGESAFVVNVPAGGQLSTMVEDALSEIGRVFGAATLADAVRAGRHQPAEHDQLLSRRNFRRWNHALRQVAPPLIVRVCGADLHAAALGDFVDGREKIVLIVDAPAPPAPLARSITPGTLVLQTIDAGGLDRVAEWDGPALAAVVPDSAAVFRHEPASGREAWQRIAVSALGETPSRSIGGASPWQMIQDQQLLADLARTPFSVPTAGKAATPAIGADDAVARLAAWLVDQSGTPPS